MLLFVSIIAAVSPFILGNTLMFIFVSIFCHDSLECLPFKGKEEQEKGLRLCIHVTEFDERVEDNLHYSLVVRSSKLRYMYLFM